MQNKRYRTGKLVVYASPSGAISLVLLTPVQNVVLVSDSPDEVKKYLAGLSATVDMATEINASRRVAIESTADRILREALGDSNKE